MEKISLICHTYL